MASTLRFCVSICAFLLLVGCSSIDNARQSRLVKLAAQDNLMVAVDPTWAAYTIVIAVTPEIRKKAEKKRPGQVQYFTAEHFRDNVTAIIRPRIVTNYYKVHNFYSKLAELVLKYPQQPIGVTWQGGVAITQGDIQHSERMLELWESDRDQFLKIQNDPENSRRDPTNPEVHFGPLLQ